jgi:hypothetical protein
MCYTIINTIIELIYKNKNKLYTYIYIYLNSKDFGLKRFTLFQNDILLMKFVAYDVHLNLIKNNVLFLRFSSVS